MSVLLANAALLASCNRNLMAHLVRPVAKIRSHLQANVKVDLTR